MEAKTCAIFQISFHCAFLFLISNLQTAIAAVSTDKTCSNTYKIYILTSCNSTTYPADCYKSLKSYYNTIKTDPLKLCKTSLKVTLKTARNTSALVSSIAKQGGLSSAEKAIVKDCIDEISDSIDELKDSLDEMEHLGTGSRLHLQIANIQTWVSAALTDENTCTDEIDEGNKVSKSVKNKIRKSVVNLAKQTSNSLALINNNLKS
ncbi:pectinesterase inhibitor 4-like [Pistacia vera]|uniref:pectinesterase inhibitor 4-like n=1 Tax=Pistacia vera TaxID=55513 RepID=UPI001263E45B|nr:pectinesterase inhibitor 4-like [Pistacia vera]